MSRSDSRAVRSCIYDLHSTRGVIARRFAGSVPDMFYVRSVPNVAFFNPALELAISGAARQLLAYVGVVQRGVYGGGRLEDYCGYVALGQCP